LEALEMFIRDMLEVVKLSRKHTQETKHN